MVYLFASASRPVRRMTSPLFGAPDRSGRSPISKARGPNIPPKRNRKDPICFSPYLYRAPNLVERFFNKMKQCRRITTRIWLRVYESRPGSSAKNSCPGS
jgi:transposase